MFSSSDMNILNKVLEQEANKLIIWFTSNKLILNPSKTNGMLFTNKRHNLNLNLTLDNHCIDMVTEATFLGVVIDNKLSWKAHVKHISSKISKSIAILRILRFSYPISVLRLIYMSLIYSHINYCNLIWGSANQTTLDPLLKLQKKAVRLVNKAKYLDHTEPIFHSLQIMTIHKMFMLNCLVFVYKCLKCYKYPNYKSRMIRNSDVHSYNTRGNDSFVPPWERLDICKNSFFVRGLKLWNVLNDKCKSAVSCFIFKRYVKIELLNNNIQNV